MATVDLNITKYNAIGTPVEFTFDTGGLSVGNKKLAQSWIKLFLTDLGSQEYYPESGSGFLDAIRAGRIRRSADVSITFKTAADNVANTLNRDPLTAELPDTEQLDFATLESYLLLLEESRLELTVKLTPVAGDQVTFTVPVAI